MLKLNYMYPQIGVAVRLEGLRGRDQRRGPDEAEQATLRERESARERQCESHGVRLLHFDVYDEPQGVFRALQATLSWALRQAATAELPPDGKLHLMEMLRQARACCDEMHAKVRSARDLGTWAELWVDRAYKEARSAPAPLSSGPVPRYVLNMKVRHPAFGTGRVIAQVDEEGDQIITVRFDSGDERQFLARLVADKLRPA